MTLVRPLALERNLKEEEKKRVISSLVFLCPGKPWIGQVVNRFSPRRLNRLEGAETNRQDGAAGRAGVGFCQRKPRVQGPEEAGGGTARANRMLPGFARDIDRMPTAENTGTTC